MFSNKLKTDKKENESRVFPENRRQSFVLSHKLSNRIFFIIAIAEAAVLVLAGYFIIIKAMSDGLKSVKQDLSSHLAENNNLNKEYKELLRIDSLYKNLDKLDIEKTKMLLPEKMNLSDLLVGLDAISKNNGFILKSISFKVSDENGNSSKKIPVKKQALNQSLDEDEFVLPTEQTEEILAGGENSGKVLKTVVLTMEIEGSGYTNVKKFISQLENNLRLLDIKELSFAPEKTSFSITVHSYYY